MTENLPSIAGTTVFPPGHAFTDEELEELTRDIGLPPFGVAQLKGFGPDCFLVSVKQQSFMIGAEFKPASGGFHNQAFIATAINTMPHIAGELLALRRKIREMKPMGASRRMLKEILDVIGEATTGHLRKNDGTVDGELCNADCECELCGVQLKLEAFMKEDADPLPDGWYWRQGPTIRAEHPCDGGCDAYCEWTGSELFSHNAPIEVVREVLRNR